MVSSRKLQAYISTTCVLGSASVGIVGSEETIWAQRFVRMHYVEIGLFKCSQCFQIHYWIFAANCSKIGEYSNDTDMVGVGRFAPLFRARDS